MTEAASQLQEGASESTCWAASETRHTEHLIIHFETQVVPCLANADTTFHPLVLRMASTWSHFHHNLKRVTLYKKTKTTTLALWASWTTCLDLIRILRLANANELRTLNVEKGFDWRVLTDFRRYALKPVRQLLGSFPSRCRIHYGVLLHGRMHPIYTKSLVVTNIQWLRAYAMNRSK
jgi:hypothetical protein